jgi:ABC-2 type transport system ATP-binding protein
VVTALDFNGISKAYEGFALRGISFSVPRGYIAGLVGPNGAGKTTLMRVALGLAAVDDGSVRVFGEDPRRAGPLSARASASSTRRRRSTATCRSGASRPSWRRSTSVGPGAVRPAPRRVPCRPRAGPFAVARHPDDSPGAGAVAPRGTAAFDRPTIGLDPVFRDDLLGRLSADRRRPDRAVFLDADRPDLERIADFIVLIREGRVLYSARRTTPRPLGGGATGRVSARSSRAVAARAGRHAAGRRRARRGYRRGQAEFSGRALVEKATLEDVFLLCREPPRR